jgi:hypothetical protein
MSDSEDDKKAVLPFHEMGLDDRILKSIAKLGWIQPTLIQVTITGRKFNARTWNTGAGNLLRVKFSSNLPVALRYLYRYLLFYRGTGTADTGTGTCLRYVKIPIDCKRLPALNIQAGN